MSFDQFVVQRIGGEEMPQQLLYSVFKTLTDISFTPDAAFTNPYPEDVAGEMFVDHWTSAVKQERMITMEAYLPFDHPHLSLSIRGDKQTISELKQICSTLSFNTQSLYETVDSYRMPVKDTRNCPIEQFIYSRVEGHYQPQNEKEFVWTEENRHEQLAQGYSSLIDLNTARERGISKEVAQKSLPHNLIINATVTASLGDWLRLLERVSLMRSSYEMKTVIDKISEEIRKWVPEIYRWWHSGLLKKNSKKSSEKAIAA